jgi:hypothetical protein
MICKSNEQMINTLLRLKIGNDGTNKVASYQPDWKTRKANETTCVNLIKEIMNAANTNNQPQNKVASTAVTSKVGELADFIDLLKGL